MSLMSLISSSTTTSTTTSSSGSVAASIKAMLESKTAAATTTASTSSASSNGVTISAAAQIAAAELADNKKDFTALTHDVRATLDAQYKASKSSTPDLTEMSGRALAAIALNKGGDFNGREVAAAKAELRDRTREQFAATVGGAVSVSGLAAYNQQLVAQYDAISDEEREALGWTEKVRSSAAAFVSTASAPSLFDQLQSADDGAF